MQDFDNLGDNVDYSVRFVMDREFDFIDELHAWADEIALEIDFSIYMCLILTKRGTFESKFILTMSTLW